jgi:hypothetical protein
LRRLIVVGRLFVDPKPVMPSKDGVQYRQSLHPIMEPFDPKGIGVTSCRLPSTPKAGRQLALSPPAAPRAGCRRRAPTRYIPPD